MQKSWLNDNVFRGPAFVIDETNLRGQLDRLLQLRELSGCKILYSMKALPLQPIVEMAGKTLDGVSVSSLFEAKLAKELIGDNGSLHLTSPGLREAEFTELSRLCTHVSFNSISQWHRLSALGKNYSPGLRINPKLSFLNDERFDPCRHYSKLGVDIDAVDSVNLKGSVEGIHFHTVFSCRDFVPLFQTLELITERLLKHGNAFKWINLGGGYLFSQINDYRVFIETVRVLTQRYGLEVFIEPGKDVVGEAGFLVANIVDRFESGGKTVAILDTSVNHNPEVFEYQRKPDLWRPETGIYRVILAGSTCLAGDVFGEYAFDRIPEVGEQIVFKNVGAYTLIKANRFNGYNLPEIYLWDGNRINKLKQYDFLDYRRQWRIDE